MGPPKHAYSGLYFTKNSDFSPKSPDESKVLAKHNYAI